jgi:DNA polymerase III subunit delta
MSDFGKFATSVRKGKFPKACLVHGNEDYFISKAVDLLIENVVAPDQRSFNLDVLDGSESTSESVLSSALSFPFVGERRLTVVRRFDKMDRKHRLDIAGHLADIPESNVVCLVAGEIKTTEEPYKTIAANAEVLTFNRLKGQDLSEFLLDTAKSCDKELGAGAADLLVDMTGDSVGDLISEIEKLSLYVGDNKKIEIEDVSTVVGKSRSFNIFELQKAVGQRDAKRAQEVAAKMIETGEKPVYMDFMLAKYFLNLLEVKHCLAKNMNPKDISTAIFGRYNPFINEYAAAARAYSIPELKNAIAVLLDVDTKLKTGGYGDSEAITVLVSEIAGRNPGRAT